MIGRPRVSFPRFHFFPRVSFPRLPSVQRLCGRKVLLLKKCRGRVVEDAKKAYWKFKAEFGEELERLARVELGMYGNTRFLTYGQFEHLCCEWRKCKSAEGTEFADMPIWKTSARFCELLPYR